MVYLAQLNYKQLKRPAMFTNFFGLLNFERITGIQVGSNNFVHAESFPPNSHSVHSAGEQLIHPLSISFSLMAMCP